MGDPKRMRVEATAIIMPVHNALEYTKRSLEQLEKMNPDTHLFIVDDASDEATTNWLKEYSARRGANKENVWLFRNEKQQLFTRTVNRGLRHAYSLRNCEEPLSPLCPLEPIEYKSFVVLNSDVDLVGNHWLYYLMKPVLTSNTGIVAYRDEFPDNTSGGNLYDHVYLPEYTTGHAICFNPKLLEDLGVLCETDIDGREDKTLAPFKGQAHIGSERILCWKALEAGWDCVYCNYPGVKHEAGMSWHRNLGWLSSFDLQPLWKANDKIDEQEEWI